MWVVAALAVSALVGAAGSALAALALARRRARSRLRVRARIRLDMSRYLPEPAAPGEPVAVELQAAENDDPRWAAILPTAVGLVVGLAAGLLAPFALVGAIVTGAVCALVAFAAGLATYALLARGPRGAQWYAEVLEDHDVVRERRARRGDTPTA